MKLSIPYRHAFAILLGAVFFLALAPSQQAANAQVMPVDARIVHSLNYNSCVVKAQWLPYGRRWAIQGNTLRPESEIHAVVGQVTTRTGKHVTRSCWVAPPDVHTDVFRLVFEPLDIGRRYDLRMDFYGTFDVNVLAPALDEAYERTVNSARSTYPYVKQQQIRDIFLESIEQELGTIFAQDDVLFIRNLRDGDCEIVNEAQQVPGLNIESALLSEIAEAVLTDVRAEERTEMLDQIQDSNRELLGNETFAALHESLQQEELSDFGFLQSGDADALQTSIAGNNVPDEEVIARLYATARSCRNDANFPGTECDMLNTIVERSYDFIRELKLQSGEYNPIKTRLLADLGQNMSQLYTQVANTRISAVEWDDAQSTSDRIRIGTAVSMGAAALNLTPAQARDFNLEDVESFAMVSLKFYPFAVDKKLPKPYFGREFLARTSLITGLLLKRRLTFQGQDLMGATGNIYPVVGIGFDISKNITLQGGATFFRQPSVSALDPTSEFKAAPVLSMGFDFDGVNWIRDRFRDWR